MQTVICPQSDTSCKTYVTDYEETVRDVIKRMSEIQKLDLTRDKKLYESLLYHLPPMILRLQNNIQIVNPMLDNIKQEYPELLQRCGMHLHK